jgi:putative SOS response-associated peptidase YedK
MGILVNDSSVTTWLCASKGFKKPSESRIILDVYYQLEQQDSESPLMFCVRNGWETFIATVIAPNAKDRRPDAFPMKWGFVHPTRGMLVFNTCSKTAAEKTFFATSILDRRCLIPAFCYYEWQKAGKAKIQYAIQPKDEPLYMAGLYIRSSKERLPCFSILTMDAADSIKEIHTRMPVMIRRSKIVDWLSPEMPYNEIIHETISDYSFTTA